MQSRTDSGAAITLTVLVVSLAISISESKPRSTQVCRRNSALSVQQSEEGYCTLPPPLENGRFSPSRSSNKCPSTKSSPACQMMPGTPVPPDWPIFSACNPGYKLEGGQAVSVCVQGRWTPPLPRCVVASCRLPPQPANGHWMATTLCRTYEEGLSACRDIPGSVVPNSWRLKYTCDQGYQLSSNSEYSVCENGAWTNPVVCVPSTSPRTGNGGTAEKSTQFTCPEPNLLTFGDHSRHPLPGSCNMYVMCIRDGTYKVGNCEVGKSYDKTLQMCQPSHLVKC